MARKTGTGKWSRFMALVSGACVVGIMDCPLSLSLWSVSRGRSRIHDRCHAGLSIARRLAIARPKLSGWRSSSTILSQVCLGLPVLCRQSLAGPRMQARRAREWSWPVSARHRWQEKDKRHWRIVSDRSGCHTWLNHIIGDKNRPACNKNDWLCLYACVCVCVCA